MKRISLIMMACLLVLGMSQCKKENPVNENNGDAMRISLHVEGDNEGAKVDVTTSTGAVAFTDGDQIYVASNGVFVGILTRTAGTFSGELTGCTLGEPIDCYFLGNRTPVGTSLEEGTSTSCTIDISDQTASLPVISYGCSTENLQAGTHSYTCRLNNKCGLVKFTINRSFDGAITISNVKNQMTVNFAEKTFTPGNPGTVTLNGTSGSTRWAILLPGSGTKVTASGTNHSDSDVDIPAIANNAYIDAVEINLSLVDPEEPWFPWNPYQ